MTIETIGRQSELLPRGLPGLEVIQDWLQAGQAVDKLVRPLIASDFIPKSFKPEIPRNADDSERANAYAVAVANATSAVLYGMSLGLDPLVSLQQIYVVHGRSGMYTKMKVALAQAAGHRIWDEVYSAERAVVCGQRKGTEDVERIEITIEMAKTAGWTTSANYTKVPADMLWNRAAARVVDRIAADLLHGIQSIEDIEPDEREPVRPSVPVTAADIQARTIQPTATPARVEVSEGNPDGVAIDPAPPPADLGPAPEAASLGQTRKIYAILRSLGAGEKADGLAVISGLLEKPVASTKELSVEDATVLIDRLEKLDLQPPDRRVAAVQFLIAGPGEPQHDELPMDEAAGGERG